MVARSLVNGKYCFIFNGVFEKQKSAQSEQKNAKNSAIRTPSASIYRVRIKHNSGLRELYCSLMPQNRVHSDGATFLTGSGRQPRGLFAILCLTGGLTLLVNRLFKPPGPARGYAVQPWNMAGLGSHPPAIGSSSPMTNTAHYCNNIGSAHWPPVWSNTSSDSQLT